MQKVWLQFKPQILFTFLIIGLFTAALNMRPVPIIAIDTTLVSEVESEIIPDFGAILNVQLKKQTFFAYLLPLINQENQEILLRRETLEAIKAKLLAGVELSIEELSFISKNSDIYKLAVRNLQSVAHVQALLKRIDVIPSSLVLAQAANESAWGSSRFAQEGYNFFGQWCYSEGCGLIPLRRGASETHEVKRFTTVGESVHAYFMNLNTFSSYENLREIRQDLRTNGLPVDGISLTEGLSSYSERGDEYIWELQSMIYSNGLLLKD